MVAYIAEKYFEYLLWHKVFVAIASFKKLFDSFREQKKEEKSFQKDIREQLDNLPRHTALQQNRSKRMNHFIVNPFIFIYLSISVLLAASATVLLLYKSRRDWRFCYIMLQKWQQQRILCTVLSWQPETWILHSSLSTIYFSTTINIVSNIILHSYITISIYMHYFVSFCLEFK